MSDEIWRRSQPYKTQNDAIDNFIVRSGLDHQGEHDALLKEVETMGKALADAKQHATEAKNRAQILASLRDHPLDVASEILNSPLLQRLRERYVELQTGAGTLNQPSSANVFVLNALKAQIAEEVQQVVRAARNEALIAALTEVALRSEIASVDLKLSTWAQNERELTNLKTELASRRTAVLEAQMALLKEIQHGHMMQPAVQIVAHATVPDRPSFPTVKLYVIGTIALLLLLNGALMLPRLIRYAG